MPIVAGNRCSEHMLSRNDPAALMARFPGPLIVHRSSRRWIIILLCNAALTAAGFWLVSRGVDVGWATLLLFGYFTLMALSALLPGGVAIRLDAEGFEVTDAFRQRRRTLWRDATGFKVSLFKQVAYDDATRSRRLTGKLNKAIRGRNSFMADTFGLTAKALSDLMNQWSQRATMTS